MAGVRVVHLGEAIAELDNQSVPWAQPKEEKLRKGEKGPSCFSLFPLLSGAGIGTALVALNQFRLTLSGLLMSALRDGSSRNKV